MSIFDTIMSVVVIMGICFLGLLILYLILTYIREKTVVRHWVWEGYELYVIRKFKKDFEEELRKSNYLIIKNENKILVKNREVIGPYVGKFTEDRKKFKKEGIGLLVRRLDKKLRIIASSDP